MNPGLFRASLFFPVFFLLTTVPVSNASNNTPMPLKGRVIVLDAGHGVVNYDGKIINPGKVNNYGHREHKLTMEISKKAGLALEKLGAKVVYTRTDKDYWRQSYSTVEDNKSRALFANELKADALISIHCDWHPSTKYKGVTTFYAKPNSRQLGESVHRNMVHGLKVKDRRLVQDSYTILDFAEVPTVLLETGFMSNREEARKLVTSKYQTEIAASLATGLKSYFAKLPR